MCVKPVKVHQPVGPSFLPVEVPCGRCWACLKNRQNDLIAKCIMEHMRSDWSYVLTLTYDDAKLDPRRNQSEVLEPIDFKRFMARLRKKFSVRYLVAGEYGSRKGRAHFHAALFGLGIPPQITLFQQRVYFDPFNKPRKPAWPWGFTYAEPLTFRGIQYVAKYLTKAKDPRLIRGDKHHQEWVSYSTRPPLGIYEVLALADRYADERVLPRTFRINPPGLGNVNRRFQISGVSQHMFLERLFGRWPEAFDKPMTEWMENARLRYIKWRAKRAWEALSNAQRDAILMDETLMRQFQKPLTDRSYDWQDWLQSPASHGYWDDKRRLKLWLEAREDAVTGGRRPPRRLSVGNRYGGPRP